MEVDPFLLGLEADAIALDVENANRGPSICAFGMAFVSGGAVTWSGSVLVKLRAEYAFCRMRELNATKWPESKPMFLRCAGDLELGRVLKRLR